MSKTKKFRVYFEYSGEAAIDTYAISEAEARQLARDILINLDEIDGLKIGISEVAELQEDYEDLRK